jgi:transcriptional regulator with XRE-family HTH domain
MPDNIGAIIKKLCKEKDISPAELERKLELANASIARWEKGASPNSSALERIADYFHVSTDYLLGRTTERSTFEHWNKKYNANNLAKEVARIETIAAHLEDAELDEEDAEMLELYIKALVKNKKNQ